MSLRYWVCTLTRVVAMVMVGRWRHQPAIRQDRHITQIMSDPIKAPACPGQVCLSRVTGEQVCTGLAFAWWDFSPERWSFQALCLNRRSRWWMDLSVGPAGARLPYFPHPAPSHWIKGKLIDFQTSGQIYSWLTRVKVGPCNRQRLDAAVGHAHNLSADRYQD